MKFVIAGILLVSSMSTFANSEVKAKKAIECFEDVTLEIGIGLSQAYHGAKPNSAEERKAKARLDMFTEIVDGYVALPTACAENTETEDEKFACIYSSYKSGTLKLAKKYKAMDVVRYTPACN
jgi:hypothetical protein